MKNKKLIIRIIIGVFLLIYFSLIILLCTFILKENKYGISESKNKVYVIINKDNETDKYKNGSLVVVKKENINTIKEGSELFTYKSDESNKVYISIGKVEKICLDTNPKYYVLEGDTGNYKSNSIIGTQIKTINGIGSIINFFTNKIVFFIFVILPPLSFIMYEIYFILKFLGVGENKNIKETEEILKEKEDEDESEDKELEND